MTNSQTDDDRVVNYRTLRLLVGLIALFMPVIPDVLSSTPLASISGSYYTEARDAFVGMSTAIGVLLLAYNGYTPKEKWLSKVAAIATFFVVAFPTSCEGEGCGPNLTSRIHYVAAATLFIILTYFCLFTFRESKPDDDAKKPLRNKIYFFCGSAMSLCLAIAGLSVFLPEDSNIALGIIYLMETFLLVLFGIAWIVASKFIPFLVEEEKRLKLL